MVGRTDCRDGNEAHIHSGNKEDMVQGEMQAFRNNESDRTNADCLDGGPADAVDSAWWNRVQ